MTGHPGADLRDIVVIADRQRLQDGLVLLLRLAPPRADGLTTGMGVTFVLDDGIAREGADERFAISPLVRVELGLDR